MQHELKTGSHSEEKVKTLLLELLSPIRNSDDTPLHFNIDSQAIAGPAWDNFLGSLTPKEAKALQGWVKIEATLSVLIRQTLGNSKNPVSPPQNSQISNKDATASPAAWLDLVFTVMQAVDSQAIEILALNLEDFEERDISEQLETGLRCVQRITLAMQTAWDELPTNP